MKEQEITLKDMVQMSMKLNDEIDEYLTGKGYKLNSSAAKIFRRFMMHEILNYEVVKKD